MKSIFSYSITVKSVATCGNHSQCMRVCTVLTLTHVHEEVGVWVYAVMN